MWQVLRVNPERPPFHFLLAADDESRSGLIPTFSRVATGCILSPSRRRVTRTCNRNKRKFQEVERRTVASEIQPTFYENLTGRDAGHWSVWVNGNWRLTFKFSGEDAEIVNYQDYH